MKIGIPRALLYYYYYPFFETFFKELGCEVVLSEETNAKIISDGCKVTVSELCVPIKIFNGHVVSLMNKNVDYIFVPRFISIGKEWYCPKFIGLGEIVKYSIDSMKDKMLIVELKNKTDIPDRIEDYMPLVEKINVTKAQLKNALKKAKISFLKCRKLSLQGYTIPEAYSILKGKEVPPPMQKADLTIGLMGYVNNVYDDFVSMSAVKKLREMGVKVITFDMLDENIIKLDKSKGKQPFWTFARKVYNAANYFINNVEIDGIIHLTAFACGPDSVIGKMMELECGEKDIPFMTIRIDEHTGESHVQTRFEAFTDMLKMRKGAK